jgi:sulfoxide reductase heme-binding subunit YedZ
MLRLVSGIDTWCRSRLAKPVVFLACAIPAALLFRRFWIGELGTNPTETLLHETGKAALLMLFASLSVTPVRRLLHMNGLQRFRRAIGLWSFAYAVSHLGIYLLLDQACISWADCQPAFIAKDVLKRPFILVGMLAFMMLLTLALTSTNGWVRRLGRRWQALHRLVYVAAIAGVVHFIWKQKADISEPLRWAWVLAALLGIRVYLAVRKWRERRELATMVERPDPANQL